MFRTLRIVVLLAILVLVAASAWLTKQRTTSWQQPLRVAIYPINADRSEASARYIGELKLDAFDPVAEFMRREAARYGLTLKTPVDMFLAPLGLQKGLIGVVNAYASEAQTAQNDVVIAHELLHTLGATDKYDPQTNQPLFPDGYAEPQRQPLLPQANAEIMAGRIPLSQTDAEMPGSLNEALIGSQTAREINWTN